MMTYSCNAAASVVPTSEAHVLERAASELLDFLTGNLPPGAQVSSYTVTPVRIAEVTCLLVTMLWFEEGKELRVGRAADLEATSMTGRSGARR